MHSPSIKITQSGMKKLDSQKTMLVKKLEEIAQLLKENSISENGTEDLSYNQLIREKLFTQEELSKIDQVISNSKIIKNNKNNKSVTIGCKVKLENHKTCHNVQLVEPVEANSSEGRISIDSPLGSAVIKRKLGDTIQVISPAGKVNFTITEIACGN